MNKAFFILLRLVFKQAARTDRCHRSAGEALCGIVFLWICVDLSHKILYIYCIYLCKRSCKNPFLFANEKSWNWHLDQFRSEIVFGNRSERLFGEKYLSNRPPEKKMTRKKKRVSGSLDLFIQALESDKSIGVLGFHLDLEKGNDRQAGST